MGVIFGYHQRPDKGIPLADKGQDADGGNGIFVNRHHDAPQIAPVRTAVDFGGLIKHRRGLKKVFPHHVDIESAGNGRYDDTLEGIDPVELGNGDKILDDQKLCRYHHGGKTAEEEAGFSGKLKNRKGIGG